MTEISTGGGANVGGDISARNVAGRDDRAQTQRSGDIHFSNQDNWTLYLKLTEMLVDIRSLNVKVEALDLKIDGLPDRVGRLEKLEVVVRPELSSHASESVNLSVRMIIAISFAAFLVVVALIGFLIYLQVT